jgi:DNA-binding MarR family transcriptional regulator
MERKGLLHRRIDPEDQRAVRLALSTEGRRSLRTIAAFAHAFERRLLQDLEPALASALDEVLARLSVRLDQLEGTRACRP